MKITYYNTKDSANTINKTLAEVATEDISLPFSEPPLMFSLYLANQESYKTVNYSSLNGKFYFVNFEQMNPRIVLANFSLDLLETYKTSILESDFDISEKSTIDYNTEVPTSSKIEEKIIKSNRTITEDTSIIVTTTGEDLA